MVDFSLGGVDVHTLLTEKNAATDRDQAESKQFLYVFAALLQKFRPALVLSYGGHPVLQAALRHAKARGIVTVFSLRNHGYEDRRWYRHVDHVFTTSPYLSRAYATKIGLRSTPIVSPIAWSEVHAPEETRGFVTFVNPSLHKGAALFARLADMLGSARPDIPLLIVQSAADAVGLTAIPGLDLRKYPQIVVSPPLARPADIFSLTKLLLVPSAFEEPFGRIAAEAMINGIPPLVSDRGGLAETVAEGGRVLPLPPWMTANTRRVPSVADTQLWFDAVTELWDDPVVYARAAAAARTAAHRLYDEAPLRAQYVSYFMSLKPGGRLFDDA
jgi:glycosyltransferase involved in cell wall biosynthesis